MNVLMGNSSINNNNNNKKKKKKKLKLFNTLNLYKY